MKYLWDDKARELRVAVKRAHDAYILAANKSNALIFEGPSGLPHPDGTQRLTNAARDEHHALDEYVKALREFNDYVNKKRPDSENRSATHK
ncbi:MAG TPA: hypothetical protein VKE70_29010 [Candidatus Solibacter sp.]|nr:hypothetical protein [Candidatus Solibacter sp.]